MFYSDCNGPSSLDANDDDDVDERTDVTMKSNEGASVWLEDMGLDRKNFPSLEPGKVKMYPLSKQFLPEFSCSCLSLVVDVVFSKKKKASEYQCHFLRSKPKEKSKQTNKKTESMFKAKSILHS